MSTLKSGHQCGQRATGSGPPAFPTDHNRAHGIGHDTTTAPGTRRPQLTLHSPQWKRASFQGRRPLLAARGFTDPSVTACP